MDNSIYLRRKQKIFLPTGSAKLPLNYLASLLKNIASLGYTLSPAVIDRLKTLSLEEAGTFHLQLVSDLQTLLGAHVQYTPMYPNFPKQVMDMDEAELYINALLHPIRW